MKPTSEQLELCRKGLLREIDEHHSREFATRVFKALRCWVDTGDLGIMSQLLICAAWARLAAGRSVRRAILQGYWLGVQRAADLAILGDRIYDVNACAAELVAHYTNKEAAVAQS